MEEMQGGRHLVHGAVLAEVEGILSIDGYIDANQYSEERVATFILERIHLA